MLSSPSPALTPPQLPESKKLHLLIGSDPHPAPPWPRCVTPKATGPSRQGRETKAPASVSSTNTASSTLPHCRQFKKPCLLMGGDPPPLPQWPRCLPRLAAAALLAVGLALFLARGFPGNGPTQLSAELGATLYSAVVLQQPGLKTKVSKGEVFALFSSKTWNDLI